MALDSLPRSTRAGISNCRQQGSLIVAHHAWIQRQRATGKWHSRREPVNNLLRNYKTILARAGVEVDAFHSLRKSCITNWLKDGVPPHEVQAMAGHASIETTMKYYAKVDIDGRARVRQASERATSGIVA